MIRYRPFLNCDPPGLAEIWCQQPPSRGFLQPVTPGILDQMVLSKPYFDRHGLIVAEEEGRLVGFVHAGFPPTSDRSRLDFEVGITCLLMVARHVAQAQIASELLVCSEEYLRRSGACVLYGGALDRLGPFYLGLYGGSGSPGVLASDHLQMETFRAGGYVEQDRSLVWQRELAGFRPQVDRQTIQWKRQFDLDASPDPLPANWWEACTFGQIDRVCFRLLPRSGGPVRGEAHFWDMEPIASSWGVHAMGLLRLTIHGGLPFTSEENSLAAFLLAETMRQLQSGGVTLVEVQCGPGDDLLLELCPKLGFREMNQGIRFRKPA